MALTTWATLRTRIRQRSDNEYSDGEFVTDAEILDKANVSRKHLFAMLVEAGLHTVPESETTISPDGSLTYALPNDFYAAAGVFRKESDTWVRLRLHSQRTYPRETVESVALTYRIYGYMEDAVIEFSPKTDSGTYKVRYIHMPADFAADSDTIDGVAGWEEWIVLDVAIDLMHKEQLFEEAEYLVRRKEKLERKIEAAMNERDALEGHSVRNVRSGSSASLFDAAGFLPGGHRGVGGWWGPIG